MVQIARETSSRTLASIRARAGSLAHLSQERFPAPRTNSPASREATRAEASECAVEPTHLCRGGGSIRRAQRRGAYSLLASGAAAGSPLAAAGSHPASSRSVSARSRPSSRARIWRRRLVEAAAKHCGTSDKAVERHNAASHPGALRSLASGAVAGVLSAAAGSQPALSRRAGALARPPIILRAVWRRRLVRALAQRYGAIDRALTRGPWRAANATNLIGPPASARPSSSPFRARLLAAVAARARARARAPQARGSAAVEDSPEAREMMHCPGLMCCPCPWWVVAQVVRSSGRDR